MGSLSELASLSLFLLEWEITDRPSEECLRRRCPDVPAVPNRAEPQHLLVLFSVPGRTCSTKGQMRNLLSFTGHKVSGSLLQILSSAIAAGKQPEGITKRNGHRSVPVKLYLHSQVGGRIRSVGCSSQSLVFLHKMLDCHIICLQNWIKIS